MYDSSDDDDESSWSTTTDSSLSSANSWDGFGTFGFRKLGTSKNPNFPGTENRPYPRSGHRMVSNDKFVLVIGGYNPTSGVYDDDENDFDETPILNDVWMFNLITKRWTEVVCERNQYAVDGIWCVIPSHLASHSALLHDNYVLVFGGSAFPFGSTSSNDFYLMEIKSGSPISAVWRRLDIVETSKPPKQYGHAMVMHNNKLYIIGGTSGFQFNMNVFELSLDDILSSEISELQWTQLLRGPECRPRYRHEAFFLDGQLMVLGGGTSHDVCSLDQVDVFDFASGYWSKRPTFPDPEKGYPEPRRCHGLAQMVDTGCVYISGGTNSTSDVVTSSQILHDVWILNKDLAWRRLPHNLPEPMYFHAMTITPNCTSLLVFGGVGRNGKRSARMYRYYLKPAPLKELALGAFVDYVVKRDGFDKLSSTLQGLGVPNDFLDWVNGVWK